MKIDSIRIENVLRISDVDIALKHPVSVFCGDNDQGKTSLLECVRLAFTGEAVRVALKKNWGQLVHGAATMGSAVVEFTTDGKSGRAGAIVPTGKHDCKPECPPSLPFILDAPRFAAMEDTERRRFLFDLMGVKTNVDAVKERLGKRGVRKDLIGVVVPILRTGFESAEKYATEKQTEWRAAWKATTGETYGEVKAETWKAPTAGADVNSADIKSVQTSIDSIREEERQLQREIGAAESYINTKSRFDRESVGLRTRSEAMGKLKKDRDTAAKAVQKKRPDVEKLKAKLTDARLAGQPCPSCGTILGIRIDKLVEMEVTSDEDLAALEGQMRQEESALRTLEAGHAKIESDYADAVSAANSLAQLQEAVGTPTTPEKLANLKKGAADLQVEIKELEEKRAGLEKDQRAAAAAVKLTEDAKIAHDCVRDWGVVKDAVSPTGIPSELLQEALEPLNRRLQQSARMTGWSLPQVGGDMQVTVNGRPYKLCGESAKWRADAMLAEAIARSAGLNILILDRFDVLAPARRGALIDWCFDLADNGGYETILLFGTLKEKPTLDGADVFWIKDGRIA